MTDVHLKTGLVLMALLGLAPVAAAAFEDVSMGASVNNDHGRVFARWDQGGFDVYHIGWRENGGQRHALERDGGKRFVFLTNYRPGAIYKVEVQGCVKHAFAHDQCTSFTQAVCGERGTAC